MLLGTESGILRITSGLLLREFRNEPLTDDESKKNRLVKISEIVKIVNVGWNQMLIAQ